jgi:hypothetical protein
MLQTKEYIVLFKKKIIKEIEKALGIISLIQLFK